MLAWAAETLLGYSPHHLSSSFAVAVALYPRTADPAAVVVVVVVAAAVVDYFGAEAAGCAGFK